LQRADLFFRLPLAAGLCVLRGRVLPVQPEDRKTLEPGSYTVTAKVLVDGAVVNSESADIVIGEATR
jgi:hypothetical protein